MIHHNHIVEGKSICTPPAGGKSQSGVNSSSANSASVSSNPIDILDHIDLSAVTDRLRDLLEILNRSDQTVVLDEDHAAEIKEYLDLLDLTRDIDIRHGNFSPVRRFFRYTPLYPCLKGYNTHKRKSRLHGRQ